MYSQSSSPSADSKSSTKSEFDRSSFTQVGVGQSVSIIVPCFNESEGIEHLKSRISPVLEKLRTSRPVELVLVDDGSTDDTSSKMQHHFGPLAKVVRHDVNRGILAAMQTGLANSTGDVVCTLDSDCTYDPNELPGLLALLRDDVDIVTGSQYHPAGTVKNVPPWRLSLSKNCSRIYQIVLPQKLYTYTSFLRAYRREVLETVPAQYPRFLGVTEILVEAILSGYKVVEYPTELSVRVYGQSKMRVASTMLNHLEYIVKLVVRRLSGRLYTRHGKWALDAHLQPASAIDLTDK